MKPISGNQARNPNADDIQSTLCQKKVRQRTSIHDDGVCFLTDRFSSKLLVWSPIYKHIASKSVSKNAMTICSEMMTASTVDKPTYLVCYHSI